MSSASIGMILPFCGINPSLRSTQWSHGFHIGNCPIGLSMNTSAYSFISSGSFSRISNRGSWILLTFTHCLICFCHRLHFSEHCVIFIPHVNQLIFGLCLSNQLWPRIISVRPILSRMNLIHSICLFILTRSLHLCLTSPCLFSVL